jgi:hypothetical protein
MNILIDTEYVVNWGTNYSRCIRLDGPAARCSGRPKLPRQFVPVRNFEPRLFVPMPGNMGRPAFTFINLYIFCNLQRIQYQSKYSVNVQWNIVQMNLIMWNWDDKCSRSYSITHGTLTAILSNRWPAFPILVSLPTNKQTNEFTN